MKVWINALCINQADFTDRNTHVLRIKDIFGGAFSVTVWTKNDDDLGGITGLQQLGERLTFCEVVHKKYGKRVLEEVLGARKRDWGVSEDEDCELRTLVRDVDVLVFENTSRTVQRCKRPLYTSDFAHLARHGSWSRHR